MDDVLQYWGLAVYINCPGIGLEDFPRPYALISTGSSASAFYLKSRGTSEHGHLSGSYIANSSRPQRAVLHIRPYVSSTQLLSVNYGGAMDGKNVRGTPRSPSADEEEAMRRQPDCNMMIEERILE